MKLHDEWRRIMRLAKLDELRRQVEVLADTHQQALKRRNAVLQARS